MLHQNKKQGQGLIQRSYDDYSNHIGLRISHRMRKIRSLPIKGVWRITDLINMILPKPTPKGPCLVKTIHGFVILVDPILDKGVERAIFFNGTYEEGTLRVISSIMKNVDIFIDIGANIGLMSLHAAKLLDGKGRVLSFEPLSSTFDILLENIELNKFDNIEAVNIAIGSTNETANIFDKIQVNRGSSSLIRSSNTESSHKTIVECLDNFLEKEPRIKGNIGCIKIDVEGWELEVLKGAKSTLSGSEAPICIIECSNLHPTFGGEPKDIYNFLRKINYYKIFCLTEGKEKSSKLLEIKHEDYLPNHDNLFCFLPKDIKKMPKKMFAFNE
jgi:FkbM family methyltransferase